ncbi:DEAD/DEAH box helicase family protein [Paenibacillus humicus]|uniref:DEAD/DEAH box helicase family protein n=1 Tax=Paenibacillus humicus TaxID=412861 RepID=UPI003F15050E
MPLNVDFLNAYPQWEALHEHAAEAEANVFANPRTSLFYCRASLERAVRWMYSHDGYLELPQKERPTLSDLIHAKSFIETIPQSLFQPIKLIIKLGNIAVHEDTSLTKDNALLIFEHLFLFLNWMQDYYLESPISALTFNKELIPLHTARRSESMEDLQRLEKHIEDKDRRIQEIEQENANLKRKIEELASRPHNPRFDLTPDTEARTRQLIIDVMLRDAGWNPHGKNVREVEVEGMDNRTGLGYCDYVLWSDSELPLAVIEAKKTSRSPKEGKKQAQNYADLLEKKYGQRPIMFYTNGYETWMWDDVFYPERRVSSIFSKADLEWAIQKRSDRKILTDYSPNSLIAGRVYQIEGITRAAETYQKGHRRSLLVMATGTGKTRTAIAYVDMLRRAGWTKNILFLADRKELVRQARGEFKKHLPSATTCNLVEDKDDPSARLYFSTYQTMMGFIDPGKRPKFSPGHFDLIIIDEAHRSIYNKFGLLFDYFDSLLLGLTATPKSDVDHDTYKFFKLPLNVPTFAYEYEQAIEDKSLVPVNPVSIFFKFLHQGMDRDELSDEEKEEYDEKIYPHKKSTTIAKEELNRFLYNKDTIRQAMSMVFEHGLKVEGGDKLGKTIVFARNKKHAELIVTVIDEMMPQEKGKIAAEIHYGVSHSQTLILNFKEPKNNPTIAVSVDMLDTGIDVPEVVNLVVFKPVLSLTKFWQMIGRGTRLREDLFGPGKHKTHALLFDLCGNVDYFNLGKKDEPKATPLSITGQLFQERIHLIRELGASGDAYHALQSDIIQTLVSQLSRMDEHYFALRPHIPTLLKFRHADSFQWLDDPSVAILTGDFAKRVYDDEPEDKKRIDLLHVRLQRHLLGLASIPAIEAKKEQLQDVAEKIYKKRMDIPQVAKYVDMLRGVMDIRFFERTSAMEMDEIRKVIREFVRLLDSSEKVSVFTDIQDKMTEPINFGGKLPSFGDFKDYKSHISEYIKKHQDHLAIQRIRRNREITEMDVEAYADMLEQEQVGTKEQFRKHFGTDAKHAFGIFVKEILGLERSAAQEAFANLLNRTNLNANQINFINMIIDHLSVNGILEPSRLADKPFVSLHHEGVFGLFDEDTVDEIVQVVETLRSGSEAKTS